MRFLIIIRKALPSEIGLIQNRLIHDAKESNVQLLKVDDIEDAMIIEVDDLIAGYGILDIYGDKALLRFVYIFPEHRGDGLGDGLVRALINYADRRGVKKIYLCGSEDTDYFTRFGFKHVCCTKSDCPINNNIDFKTAANCCTMELDVEEFFNTPQCRF
ncbi:MULTISPECIES: GNAT family N-acetyltransferase [Tepidanaerobacter]|uniref:Amino-acid N-acetyltransferase n=1 Tax=Tepidanaerobacter syntrophicus TaxID=224999 RepID=A0A0U9HH33_9FIRM|nr:MULTISPECIES: GNAT family N-acetyltransferase [Tepidanaerobacter]GAQ26153.1 amino-acid N-acetyltransferase [Tepidanaerobacter syntrophicus]GLI50227.1 hypothetical protein TSYNTROOL_03130 [Tepidanaerobacter syntrophicus]